MVESIKPQERRREPTVEDVDEFYSWLEKVVVVLKDMGFQVHDRMLDRDMRNILKNEPRKLENAMPIAWDGLDGIRVSRNRSKGLIVSFHNGFEDPDNPRRAELKDRLKQEDLLGNSF